MITAADVECRKYDTHAILKYQCYGEQHRRMMEITMNVSERLESLNKSYVQTIDFCKKALADLHDVAQVIAKESTKHVYINTDARLLHELTVYDYACLKCAEKKLTNSFADLYFEDSEDCLGFPIPPPMKVT